MLRSRFPYEKVRFYCSGSEAYCQAGRQVPLWGNVFVLIIFLCVIIRFPVWLVKESLNEPRFGQLLQAVAAAIDARVLTRASLE